MRIFFYFFRNIFLFREIFFLLPRKPGEGLDRTHGEISFSFWEILQMSAYLLTGQEQACSRSNICTLHNQSCFFHSGNFYNTNFIFQICIYIILRVATCKPLIIIWSVISQISDQLKWGKDSLDPIHFFSLSDHHLSGLSRHPL